MTRSPTLLLISVFAGWFAAADVRAEDVAVFGTEAGNLLPQDAGAVAELIAQSYALFSRQTVIPPLRSAAALAQTHTYEAAAAQLGVKEYVRISAVAAGRRIVIAAARHQADGLLLQQARQVAERIEDVPAAAQSVASALLTGSAPAGGVPVGAAPPPFRAPAPKADNTVYGFKAGLHMPVARDASYYPTVSLQFDARYELPRMFLQFGAGFVLPTVITDAPYVDCPWDNVTMMSVCPENTSDRGHTGGLTGEVGASYYLTDGDVVPYVGGGLITRIIIAGVDSYDGSTESERSIASILAYGQFGLTFPRQSTTRFFADLRASQALLSQRLENGRTVWPIEPSLHVGFGW